MAAAKGNNYAGKDKACADAIRLAMYADDRALLRRMAQKLSEKAAEGDIPSAKEVMDRLDGKPKQVIDHGVTEDTDNELNKLVASANELVAKASKT